MTWKMFKEMSLWKKIQWILQYYGVTIVVVILAITVGTIFLRSVFGPQEKLAINVMILDDKNSRDLCSIFQADLEELLGDTCSVTTYRKSDVDENQAFVVRLASEHLDLLIAPEYEMMSLMNNNYLQYMEKVTPDSYYYKMTRGDETEEQVYYMGAASTGLNTDGENVVIAENYFLHGKQ